MDSSILLELPNPPLCKAPNIEERNTSEDVLVSLLDGKTITGKLYRYVPSEKSITIYQDSTNEQTQIPLAKIRNFQLMNSKHFVLDDEFIGDDKNQVTMPSERQEYQLIYQDDKTDMGETMGFVQDENGLHLFIAQAFYNYYHQFIPLTALKDHRIGPIIGEALLKDHKVREEDVEEGLKQQDELRSKKLGEYLTSEEIISPAGLEKAIERQQNTPNLRLGEALIQEGLITDAQLDDALKSQKQNRAIPLGEILVNMNAVTPEDMKKTLASKLGIPFVNLRKFKVDMDSIKNVPEKICRRHNVMPLCLYDNKLIVAVENPLHRLPLEDLRFHTKIFVEPVMAAPEDIEWAINQYFGVQIDTLARELYEDEEEKEEDLIENIAESDNALVKLVNKMITDAYNQGASDIHIEPYPGNKKTVVRFRKDGELVPYVELPPGYRNALVSRIKIMCDLDISERRKPQDGKISFKKFGPLKIELRVATLPTAGGLEDVVMRILANGEPIPLDQMGIRKDTLNAIKKEIYKPYGLLLVCGPTGSGKTTTLHSILGQINTPEKKIWTAEDPVEITQKGLRQLQVNSKIGLSFANAMRAFLRADPDVIMVGEMRDEETTSTGIEASLTGHLVLSTLHTNSAPESVTRLLDMG
ncbi:MAG: ATPase, T2SS/T4P/T4SS family, partial [Gammaproteobacteria bacterium]|nr:ATPase, T2SS/T4P/T4SS family [Gammaproteobacteria bacterium]